MAIKIVSTLAKEDINCNMYSQLFDYFNKQGVNLVTPEPLGLDDLDSKVNGLIANLNGADFIFHYPDTFIATLASKYIAEFREWNFIGAISEGFEELEPDVSQRTKAPTRPDINRYRAEIESVILGASRNGALMDADISGMSVIKLYQTLTSLGIPNINPIHLNEWQQNKFYPAVLKKQGSCKGDGIRLIDSVEKFSEIISSNSERIQGDSHRISRFIECPSDHYTHYRVFTLGDGSILAAALSYSSKTKDSSLNIISNRSAGGIQIPLNPNKNSRKITNYEMKILGEHKIINQRIPETLERRASETATLLSLSGLYILGQDWIQDKQGRLYCLECNLVPDRMVFDGVYNQGQNDRDAANRIAAEKIGAGIIKHIEMTKSA